MNEMKHKFKPKWWAIMFAMIPPALVSLLANELCPQLFSSELSLIVTLMVVCIFSIVIMLYACWEPSEGLKSWRNLAEAFHIHGLIHALIVTLVILMAWLGVGIVLIFLPLWMDIDGWTWGGLLQFAGLIWIFIGYSLIMRFKQK